ncbi:MAG: hypothetical protein Q9222_005290, partial [Ikaeria aurantiellina]
MASFANIASIEHTSTPASTSAIGDNMPRPHPRRTSSAVGDHLRGDNAVAALSTLEPPPPFDSSGSSSSQPESQDDLQHAPDQEPLRRRPGRRRRKVRGWFGRWKEFSLRHTWANPLIIILALLASYGVRPRPTNPLHSALFLSYPLSSSDPLIPADVRADPNAPTHYGKGPKDFAFVAFYIVVLSFTREFSMQVFLRPLARWFQLRSRSKQNRFLEQMYSVLYFGVSGPFGMYVMSRTPVWYFNTAGMYETFPNRTHEGMFKAYYLLQASYWAQQAMVLCLQLEKPRKDFR